LGLQCALSTLEPF